MSQTIRKKIRKNGREISRGGKILVTKVDFGLYTVAEIDALIADDYIPVATASELDGLRNAVTQTMGAGTEWEGDYLTGLDKKYVQVRDIDLINYQAGAGWNPIKIFNGVFDGNNLIVSNMKRDIQGGGEGLFSSVSNRLCALNNINIVNAEVFGGAAMAQGILCGFSGGLSGSIIDNCHIYNSSIIVSQETIGGGSELSALCARNYANISNCTVNNTSVSYGLTNNIETGAICGQNDGTISNSKAINVDVFAYNLTGAFVGDNYGTIDKCNASGTAESAFNTGGFVGVNKSGGVISNCHTSVNTTSTNNQLGGFVGNNLGGTINNSYSYGAVVGVSNVGGFSGVNSGTITNSYYDTQTSGQSDIGKGEGRTTAQMKKGFENAILDTDGNVDPTGDTIYEHWNSEYDEILEDYVPLAQAIWRFTPITQYPTLL